VRRSSTFFEPGRSPRSEPLPPVSGSKVLILLGLPIGPGRQTHLPIGFIRRVFSAKELDPLAFHCCRNPTLYCDVGRELISKS